MGAPSNGWPPGRDFRLYRLVQDFRRFRWMVASIVAVCVIGSLLVAIFMTKVYEARTVLLPVATTNAQSSLAMLAGQFSGLAAQLGFMQPGANNTQEAIATIKSRAFIESFVKDYELLPELFADRWDAGAKRWDVDEPRRIPTPADGYELFNKEILSVSQDLQTGLVELTIQWRDREHAAEWANALVRRVNERLRHRAVAEATRSIDFLNVELKKPGSIDLQEMIYRLIESSMQSIALANVRDEYAFKVIDPAEPPEIDRFVRPKRILLLLVGFVFGGFLSAMAVLMRSHWEAGRLAFESQAANG
jgi:uncharacterized protein involved in exopolysaccharide biosynthesis